MLAMLVLLAEAVLGAAIVLRVPCTLSPASSHITLPLSMRVYAPSYLTHLLCVQTLRSTGLHTCKRLVAGGQARWTTPSLVVTQGL